MGLVFKRFSKTFSRFKHAQLAYNRIRQVIGSQTGPNYRLITKFHHVQSERFLINRKQHDKALGHTRSVNGAPLQHCIGLCEPDSWVYKQMIEGSACGRDIIIAAFMAPCTVYIQSRMPSLYTSTCCTLRLCIWPCSIIRWPLTPHAPGQNPSRKPSYRRRPPSNIWNSSAPKVRGVRPAAERQPRRVLNAARASVCWSTGRTRCRVLYDVFSTSPSLYDRCWLTGERC